ncbi:MAG: relaxase/mobilization nuclease domain-containing protein [Lachnospiraceae bacterium]|nr:relaxase/mobilization nuclease domain-containing protein [Lachnospiraceae bacterium]
MAIEKDIAIHHTSGIKNVIAYTGNPEKAVLSLDRSQTANGIDIERLVIHGTEQDIINALSYAENLEKTIFRLDGDDQLLVSGVLCDKDHAVLDFQMTRQSYYDTVGDADIRIKGTKTDKKTGETVKKESIEAYHVIQSFPEVEGLDPRLVHQIGIEYARAAFPGHQCVVSTHMNTDHLHNHIIVNAYSKEHFGRKYRMNMERRREIRCINDELSLKYNLPILLDNDLNNSKGISWKEWKSKQDGQSWKEKLKNDILSASSMSGSWEEFKNLMTRSGYKIRETKSTVTYTMPGSETMKCRDSRLGAEYTRTALLSGWHEKASREDKKAAGASPKVRYETARQLSNPLYIHINRYTASGRRRTELEMLILTAIRIIQFFKDRFLDLVRGSDQKKPANLPYTKKIDHMYKALEMLKKYDVSSKVELKARMNDAGAKLSHARKEIRDLEPVLELEAEICEKIKSLQKLEADLGKKAISPDRLFVHSFSEKEIAHNIAALQPMIPGIRRQLYQKANDKKLFLKYKFEDISLSNAKAVIDYVDGKSDIMPSCLLTPEEARNIALKRQAEPPGYVQTATNKNSSVLNSELDRKFELLTYHYNKEEKELLFAYRNLLNELAAYGVTSEQISEYLAQHESKQQAFLALQKQMVELKNEYRDLCHLKVYIDLAENDRFLRGPLFNVERPVSEETIAKEPGKETTSDPSPEAITDDTLSH